MAQREMRFERRMSDQEALMWNVEKDPWLNPNGAMVTVLDRPVDHDQFRHRLRRAVADIPRLRERVVPGLGRLSPPVWATDREFDLDYHIRRISLPGPGSMRQLFDLATYLYEDPYDRTRPLWVFWSIDGLEGGKGALFSKLHHSVADGIGALRMAMAYTELERDAELPPDVDLDAVIAEAVEVEADALREAGADMGDSVLDTATRTATHLLRRQAGIARRALGEVAGWPADPKGALETLGSLVGSVRSTADTATGGREVDAGAPLWKRRSKNRHLETLRFRLADAKAASKALGGTVNDLFVTGAVIGALAYHEERGSSVDALNLTFVISTRTDKAMGGNAFTPVPLQVRGGDLSAEERFIDTRDRMAARARNVSGRGAMSTVAGIANLLPTSVVTRVARQQAAKVDLATSNMRGASMQTYTSGAAVEAMYPLGPVAGTAANLTMISQNGWCDAGLLVDPAAVEDPAGLRDHVEAGYRQIMDAGGVVT